MKDKKILYGIILFIIFLLSIGLTYAYFNVTTSVIGDRNDIKTSVGTLNILYTDGPEIVANKIQPGWTTTKTITIENIGTLDTNYSIEWAELTNEITNDELVMSATCEQTLDGSVSGTCSGINEIPVATSTGSIVHNINLSAGYKHTYVITFEFIEISSIQNYNQGKAFSGVINILGETYTLAGVLYDSNGDPIEGANIEMHSNPKYATTDSEGNFEIVGLETGDHTITITSSTDEPLATDSIMLTGGSEATVDGKKIIVNNSTYSAKIGITLNESSINSMEPIITLTDKILSDNTAYAVNSSSTYVTAPTGVNFGSVSSDTNGKGLYYTTDTSKTEDGKRVYFFRGAVPNNYLIFGGFCWRIVRTVEDGSIRIRYGGTPSNGVCPQTGTSVSISSKAFSVSAGDNDNLGFTFGGTKTPVEGSSTDIYIDSYNNYYYGSSYAFNSETGEFSLSGSLISGVWGTSSICDSSSCPVANYYTCRSSSSTGTCTSLYKMYSYANSMDPEYSSEYGTGIYINAPYVSSSYANATSNSYKSAVLEYLNTWYNSNLSTYSAKIADTPYCNDRSIYSGLGYGSGATTYNGNNRLVTNKIPTYKCSNSNDKFSVSTSYGNGYLTYPIGLITADELYYAGASYSKNNTTYYIYTNDQSLTMTPATYSDSAYMFTIRSGGTISTSTSNGWFAVIPTISLKNTVSVTSGAGLYNNPYIVN